MENNPRPSLPIMLYGAHAKWMEFGIPNAIPVLDALWDRGNRIRLG